MATFSSVMTNEYPLATASESVEVIEAPPGEVRSNWLANRLEEYSREGARTFHVSCDFAMGGPWGGMTQFFAELLPEIKNGMPDLIERHAFELVYVLPLLRKTVTVRNPNLTDLSPLSEKTRNYPADRAIRNVHGLIDLVDEWKGEVCPRDCWVLACDSFDDAGVMSALFFRELMRRRAKTLNLRMLLAVAPGQGQSTRESLDESVGTALLIPQLQDAEPAPVDRAAAAKAAEAIEQQIGNDEIEMLAHLPRLFSLWKTAGRPDKTLHYQFTALANYNTNGLYADALRYTDGLLALATQEAPDNYLLHWAIFNKTLMCHLGLNDFDSSLEIVEKVGLALAPKDPVWHQQLLYLMAMMYARFKSPRDFEKGEDYLEQGLAVIRGSNIPEGERHFHECFNRNGLAMIRSFQGRPEEALELCRDGLQRLNENVASDVHRLHRSILIYNMAQVFAAIGANDEALERYAMAISMDPNYSEYYNDRGSVLLKLDRLEEAKADYLHAIELSPPYFEVFTNLGQCYRRMGNTKDAIQQYSRALDLQPKHILAFVGRGKAYEEAGEADAAIQDYDAALALAPTLWEALGSRGVLHYEAGRLHDSLADFDAAIALKPDFTDLHENRAVVLADIEKLEAELQERVR